MIIGNQGNSELCRPFGTIYWNRNLHVSDLCITFIQFYRPQPSTHNDKSTSGSMIGGGKAYKFSPYTQNTQLPQIQFSRHRQRSPF